MKLDENIFELLRTSIKFNKGIIVKDNEEFFEIDDQTAQIFYIYPKIEKNLIEEIKANTNKEPTFSIISKHKLSLTVMPPFKCFRETFQYSYRGKAKEINSDFAIKPLTMDDMEYFKKHYYRNGNDENYLLSAIKRGMLKAEKDHHIVGFVGEHPEHALGLLFVDENYRRQGIGKTLEQAMINKILEENRTPIEHVVLTNECSKKLQASIEGMELDDGFVYWLF